MNALRAGDVVEVRSEEEILRTLDADGKLDGLPFMPEMLGFCGRQYRVSGRAHKACDTINWQQFRRMESAVHLEELRCDGSAHGGCQAGCLLYWKEAWLRPVDQQAGERPPETDAPGASTEALTAATQIGTNEAGQTLFSCQATELLRASKGLLPWWEPSQYVEDVTSGNSTVPRVIRALLVGLFNRFQRANARFLPRFCLIRGCKRYPFIEGKATSESTPSEPLDLQPGEMVEIKSREEIFATLDENDTTLGLRFDGEMLRYCGRRARVLRRIEKIIDEKTGRMLTIKRDTVILEGVICVGDYHRSCPRAIYPYWREAWLRRVAERPGDVRAGVRRGDVEF
jgi:hypothetical protein